MGRNRKTSDDLDRTGAFVKNPQRAKARAAEPIVTDGLGSPPKDFLNPHSPTSLDLLEAWNDIIAAAREVRLTRADRLHVEMTARQLYKCRRPGTSASDYGQLDRYLAKLGLNPADRSRVEGREGHRTADRGDGTHDPEWAELAEQGAATAIQ